MRTSVSQESGAGGAAQNYSDHFSEIDVVKTLVGDFFFLEDKIKPIRAFTIFT